MIRQHVVLLVAVVVAFVVVFIVVAIVAVCISIIIKALTPFKCAQRDHLPAQASHANR